MSCADSVEADEDRAWGAWLSPLLAAAKTQFPELHTIFANHFVPTSGAETNSAPAAAQSSSYVAFRRGRTDGTTLTDLQNAIVQCQDHDGGLGATIVAVREDIPHVASLSRGSVLCGFITLFPWRNNLPDNAVFGDVERCFVFSMCGSEVVRIWQGRDDDDYYDEDDPAFRPTGILRFSAAQGLVVGGSPSGAALTLSGDLGSVSTARSGYFGNEKLCAEKSSMHLADVVGIRFLPADLRGPVGRESVAGDMIREEERGPTALKDGQDTFMLNFISSSARNKTVNRNWFG